MSQTRRKDAAFPSTNASTSAMQKTVAIAQRLGLQKHFEGGFFKETWRSEIRKGLSVILGDESRSVSSSIYYLMSKGQSLTWHKLRGDNIHTWHAGGKLQIHIIEGNICRTEVLGNALEETGCSYQVTAPSNHWYAAEVTGDCDYALWGEIVTPAWEMGDYQEATRDDLIHLYPDYQELIEKYLATS